MSEPIVVRMETGATAFECNPWVMRAAMNAVRKVFPDATMIKVYRPNEGKRPADRAFHAPLAHEIVCPLIGKLRGTHDERYGAFGS